MLGHCLVIRCLGWVEDDKIAEVVQLIEPREAYRRMVFREIPIAPGDTADDDEVVRGNDTGYAVHRDYDFYEECRPTKKGRELKKPLIMQAGFASRRRL